MTSFLTTLKCEKATTGRKMHACTRLIYCNKKNRPTAVFACSDTQAFGIYDAAHQLGLSIPEDLSVTGFDDINSARHLGPPLTTMRQPLAEMTRATLATLLSSISPKMLSARYCFHQRLSCAEAQDQRQKLGNKTELGIKRRGAAWLYPSSLA